AEVVDSVEAVPGRVDHGDDVAGRVIKPPQVPAAGIDGVGQGGAGVVAGGGLPGGRGPPGNQGGRGVVAVSGRVVVGVRRLRAVVDRVVLVPRDVLQRVGDRDQVAGRVITVQGVVAERVVDLGQPVHQVVGVLGALAVLVEERADVAGGVVLVVPA